LLWRSVRRNDFRLDLRCYRIFQSGIGFITQFGRLSMSWNQALAEERSNPSSTHNRGAMSLDSESAGTIIPLSCGPRIIGIRAEGKIGLTKISKSCRPQAKRPPKSGRPKEVRGCPYAVRRHLPAILNLNVVQTAWSSWSMARPPRGLFLPCGLHREAFAIRDSAWR
jgi:hypothetical protein